MTGDVDRNGEIVDLALLERLDRAIGDDRAADVGRGEQRALVLELLARARRRPLTSELLLRARAAGSAV